MDYRNLNSPNLTDCAMNWTPNLLNPNDLTTNSGFPNSPLLNNTALHPKLTAILAEINNNNKVDEIEPTDELSGLLCELEIGTCGRGGNVGRDSRAAGEPGINGGFGIGMGANPHREADGAESGAGGAAGGPGGVGGGVGGSIGFGFGAGHAGARGGH